MFKFIREKIDNRGTKKCWENNISTANMSSEEYMKAVEDKILPYWADRELMEKTGIKNLFAEGTQVLVKLSYDDAYECLRKAMRMVDVAAYVSNTFSERSRAMDLNSKEMFNQHLVDVKSGKKSGAYRVHHDFYSADTIRDLFIEAQNNVQYNAIEVPADCEEAMKRLNAAVGSLHYIKNATFVAVIISANAAMADMTGFKK